MSCTAIIDYQITQDLSNKDIFELTGKQPIIYEELRKYKSIDQLLGKEQFIIILYEVASAFSGHWVALYRQSADNQLVFFDSYGMQPDQEDLYAQTNALIPKYLTHLLEKSAEKYTWNTVDYQSKNSGVSTCGRWASCAVRCFRHMNIDQVQSFLKTNESAWLTPDRIVTLLTVFTLNQIQAYFKQ